MDQRIPRLSQSTDLAGRATGAAGDIGLDEHLPADERLEPFMGGPRVGPDAVVRYNELPELPSDGLGTLGDRIGQVLERAIVDRHFLPGEHLSAEAVSRRFGVSVIPVRESLRTLHAGGWVEIRPHQGAFVKAPSRGELAETFEARIVIETALASFAAERRTKSHLRSLDRLVKRGDKVARAMDIKGFIDLNSEFHETLADCARSPTLKALQGQLGKRVRFYLGLIAVERIEMSVKEHRELVDAIQGQEAATAQRVTRRHIEASWRAAEHHTD